MRTESPDDAREVIERYAPMVYRLAYARTRCRADAEDLCQEVLLRLIQKNPNFDSEEHRKAWLLRTTINLANNLFRSAWRRRVSLTDAPPEPEAPAAPPSRLGEALDRLPGRYRAVIHLYYYEDMSVEEIARTLKQKSATVRTQLTRARRRLKAELESGKEGSKC